MSCRSVLKLALVALGLVSLTGCIINVPPLFGDSRGPLTAHEITPAEGFFTRSEILVIDLTGFVSIQGTEGFFGVGGPGMLVALKDRLLAAEKNPRLKAVILRIDSAGGTVTASDLIYHEIVKFKEKKQIPVVAMLQDVGASGALYLAMAADEIYALPTTITGSIGVVITLPAFYELGEKIGLEMRIIKAGENKDLGTPWRELSLEERAIFQRMVDEMSERFHGVIMKSRAEKGLTAEELATYGDGRVFAGQVAAEIGLIDGVGYPEDVIERAKALAEIDDARIVSYEYPYSYRGNFYAQAPSPRPKSNTLMDHLGLLGVDLGLANRLPSDTRFLYMWLP